MLGLATFRVVMALVWLAMPLWFKSAKVLSNSATGNGYTAAQSANGSSVATISNSFARATGAVSKSSVSDYFLESDPEYAGEEGPAIYDEQENGKARLGFEIDVVRAGSGSEEDIPHEIAATHNSYSDDGVKGVARMPTRSPHRRVTVCRSCNNSPESTVDATNVDRIRFLDSIADRSETGATRTKSNSRSKETMPATKTIARNEAEALESASSSSLQATKMWEDKHFLKLGFNPKIEVSIEVLHGDELKTADTKDSQNPSPTTDSVPAATTLKPFAEKDMEPDMCRRWLECPSERRLLELARLHDLPDCPCTYSFDIHYKDDVWDQGHGRAFRWRDASGPPDQLEIFRPGARWCIRSLVSDGGGSSMATQQCCYNHKRRLLTRGAGAGTPYVVSPEVSRDLHYKVDVMPWMACHGDWTRYHLRRTPNNGLHCEVNPGNRIFAKEFKKAQNY